jgi:hypothetical protein
MLNIGNIDVIMTDTCCLIEGRRMFRFLHRKECRRELTPQGRNSMGDLDVQTCYP